MKNKLLFTMLLLVMVFKGKAQELSIDADIRPRFEYLNGFGTLIPDQGVDAGTFVQQRSRLKFGYKQEKFAAYLSVQDVSIWGDTPQIAPADNNNSFSIAQAWIDFKFGSGWSTKLGRQALSYDDQRIFGGLDWAMQGRFHDAALLKYTKEGFRVDIGFAFNQNGVQQQTTLFDPNNGGNARAVFDYKGMAFAWLHKDWKNFSGSFLISNNSYQNLGGDDGQTPIDGTVNRQTFGTHLVAKPAKGFTIAANLYGQTGEFTEEVDLAAYNALLELTYKPGKTLFGLGFETLSGDDNGATDGEITSFFPIFGTNHKFNGYMDYFYVGNHANNIGLNDFYAKTVIKTGEKSSLLIKAHYFSGAESLADNLDDYLGTEVDIVYTQKVLPFATLKLGYSQLFASETMEALKGVPEPADAQYWGWAMLVVKPNFLKWKPKSEPQE